MTEDTASPTADAADTGQPEQEPKNPPPPAGGGGRILGVLALLLSIAAAAVAGYLWYQVQVEQKLSQNLLVTDMKDAVNSTRLEVTALDKEFEALKADQQALRTRIEEDVTARLDTLETGQQALNTRSESLSDSIAQVYEDMDRSLESWALEEVEQLLRIANHSLQLSGDVSTAIAGLELADRRLEELANPAFLQVRERLADNVTDLKNLERVDIAGLALRLSRMAEKVENLPLAQKTKRPISTDPGTADSATAAPGDAPGDGDGTSGRWLQAGGELLQDLKQLVRIQNIDEPAKPLLTPEQRYFLFSNLRLMLSGAQIAALSRDTPTYRENLEQSGEWLAEYFDTGHQGVSQLLNDIRGMSGVELSPELPDISSSLVALQETKNRMQAQ